MKKLLIRRDKEFMLINTKKRANSPKRHKRFNSGPGMQLRDDSIIGKNLIGDKNMNVSILDLMQLYTVVVLLAELRVN